MQKLYFRVLITFLIISFIFLLIDLFTHFYRMKITKTGVHIGKTSQVPIK